MKEDRAYRVANRIFGQIIGRTPGLATSILARMIRHEVRRAVKPIKEAVDALDFSYGRAQTDEIRERLIAAIEFDPFKIPKNP